MTDYIGWVACLTALLGSALLATNRDVSRWGFVAYLVSNAAWILVALATSQTHLLVQQIGFTATSAYGVYRWFGFSGRQEATA